ncbi:hypothetical protein EDE15_2030 [Edaphobacter aggregans]|uniref:Lipid/polyisoprenoid-binding YceI-like domain-containing protein n=1 Tax=Edaphobacter aggregans TaxID=570835 RepID=A0A3R9QH69_9BACT|nr:hypothetical protein [Edaphobacter aggregans]RSL16512.1 hypothetical protein EDE15_2030 [Edaphobacter aggregans]
MTNKYLRCLTQVGVFVLAVNIGALAQNWTPDRLPEKFSGQINAYTPTTTKAPTGPYEIRGSWSMNLKREGTKADFSAAVNMILSDGWVLTNSTVPPNFDPSTRNAHTHHITMTDAEVTMLPNNAIQVSGTATVTLNGGPTPFAQQSPLTVVITGGGTGPDDVEYSNVTLTFASPASGHFGTEPLPGVVRKVEKRK